MFALFAKAVTCWWKVEQRTVTCYTPSGWKQWSRESKQLSTHRISFPGRRGVLLTGWFLFCAGANSLDPTDSRPATPSQHAMPTCRPMTATDLPAVFAVRLATVENAVTMAELAEDCGIPPTFLAAAMETHARCWLCEAGGRARGSAMGGPPH